jgi:Ni/Co efflux regulator RcnB
MKQLFACAAALGLFLCIPATAQNNDHHGDKRDAATAHDDHRTPPAKAPQKGQGHTPSGVTQPKPVVSHQNMNNGPAAAPARTKNAGAHMREPAAANTSTKRTAGPGNTSVQRPDIASLRRNMQAPQHFRNGNYRAPRGYQQRHWGYGERLPRGYFVRDYWISNFLMFGLFAPPPDLVWVRVGNDALLIDRYSGDIVQVRYGVFY